MLGQQRGEAFFQTNADTTLDQKARYDFRGVDYALALAFGNLGWFLATCLCPQTLDIGNRLLEDMTEHRDGDVAAVIPLTKICKVGCERIGNCQCIRDRIGRKQPAIVLPDMQMVVAPVDRLKKRLKVLPQGLRQECIARVLGPLKKLVRKQVRAFRERDKQNAVQDFLGDFDRRSNGSFGPDASPVRKAINWSRSFL